MIPVNAPPLPPRGAVNRLCFRVEGSTWKIALSACSISAFPSRAKLGLRKFQSELLQFLMSSRLPNVGEGYIVFQVLNWDKEIGKHGLNFERFKFSVPDNLDDSFHLGILKEAL
ncbi:hypothetical protein ES332_D05G426200v1 [Gossypium tomentosum]|uniref:Uncharacterized protein n=1 Tax=Gossypium tomentosum TaxID=34277 RepID=A0A5D2L6M5_GOSTO|nr:hypothetical protein ES332_D05G426200v1 [Gossypium tomentosum]